jgi:hypothetical protein
MGNAEFSHAVLAGTKEAGDDLHSLNQRRAGLPTRNKAKNFFYGFLFGAGDAKIGALIGQGKAAGAALKAKYLAEMPDLRQVITLLTDEWRHTAKHRMKHGYDTFYDGYLTGIDGRPILIDSEHKVLVFMLQSDEAIHMSVAYCMWQRWMDEKWEHGKDWGSLIWYHDEWEWECRPEIAQESGEMASLAIKKAGEYLKIDCPHEGDFSVGANWMEVH